MNAAHTTDRPMGYARLLSWSTLVLILASSLALSLVLTNIARERQLTKQQEFALLLAENLNHQIYRRFTLPTLLKDRRIALQDKEQYTRLDQIIQSTIHGLHVSELRIYDTSNQISYATVKELVGRENVGGKAMEKAIESEEHSFEIVSSISPFKAMFLFDAEPGTMILKTTYPLKTERTLGINRGEEQLMGVLEFSQDITADYHSIIQFQWLLITSAFLSSVGLFLILQIVIRRADAALAQRMAEQEQLEKELHQSEKLASMGRTVAGIAHEIRNPLGIIRSSAELLLKRAEQANDPSVRVIKAMHDESKRLSQTVSDFLDYARPRQPRMDPVSPGRVLGQVVGFLEREIEEKEASVYCTCPEHMTILGDPDLLYRCFYNVLTNALQAMAEAQTETRRVDIHCIKEQGMVRIRFTDNGPGLSDEAVDKCADPFYTTKDSGTGLGLAIVKSIVASHNGTLELENVPPEEGTGARVTLSFPAANK